MAAKVAGLLSLAAALAAVVLMLSDVSERPPARVPAPSRTLAPDRPSLTPTTSRAPAPPADRPRPEKPEREAG
ncbi:hypothetical protein [Streptomyces sp. NPDC004250]|uniref:hypothetical protein n=1 Tax=Streptomyces sp. NPDC004250 TaxID=3364692 RepID=UPI00369E21D6